MRLREKLRYYWHGPTRTDITPVLAQVYEYGANIRIEARRGLRELESDEETRGDGR